MSFDKKSFLDAISGIVNGENERLGLTKVPKIDLSHMIDADGLHPIMDNEACFTCGGIGDVYRYTLGRGGDEITTVEPCSRCHGCGVYQPNKFQRHRMSPRASMESAKSAMEAAISAMNSKRRA